MESHNDMRPKRWSAKRKLEVALRLLRGEPIDDVSRDEGVVERFHRTLKEQIIHGHCYRNIDELYVAVKKFISTYNEEWLLGKLGMVQK